ncbi:putative coat protein [Plasmopara viticola lesion associated toti 1]|uniref:Putative coat protein n=1 Tax=Plasmopara viticola lesion associated toti 1 TaxID=2689132 RepID=A0A6B9HCU8_9VIRU|nr:putative coat protein [Plasmopara viticola lesion associated toti 1]
MHTEYINSFLKLGIGASLDVKFGDGRFSIINKTRIHAKAGLQTYTAGLELMSDFQVTGWKHGRQSMQPTNTYYGYNKQYLDDDGVYDPLRAIDDYSKTVPGLRLNKVDLEALASTGGKADSHEAFIYNMLVSWLYAKIYRDTGGKDNRLILQQSGYSDSHTAFNYFDSGNTTSYNHAMGEPFTGTKNNLGWDVRTLENYWDRPYVFRYTSTNVPQISFYLSHLWGRSGNGPLSADVKLEGLDDQEVYLDPVGPIRNMIFSNEVVPWGSPDALWLWIMDYVRLNRVEQAFAAAFELLGAVANQPMPSYQESHLWHKANLSINLAPFSPVRARVPSNLRGEPNLHDTNAITMLSDETKAPANYITTAAVMNYTAWVGLHSMVSNFSRDMRDWRPAVESYDAEMAILATPESRAALVSLVTGKEIFTCMNNNCHITYDLSDMANVKYIADYVPLEEEYPAKLKLDGLPPYVSGSMIMGCVALELQEVAHLHGTYSFQISTYNDLDPVDAGKAASTYRLFGHDTEIVHFRSMEQYPIYANRNDSTIAVHEIINRTRDFDRLKILSSSPRTGRNVDLPGAESLSNYGSVHVTIDRPTLLVLPWQSRRNVFRPAVVMQNNRAAVHFKVGNTSQYKTAHFNIGRVQNMVSQGFHERHLEVAPAHPVISGELAPTKAEDPQASEIVAENVG